MKKVERADWIMCGIYGYTGSRQAMGIITDGLERLEYRGYDSSGVAVSCRGAVCVRKSCGRISALKDVCENHPAEGTCGIGHTRWATHGKVSITNAHPHTNLSGTIAVVHNGVIENYIQLRDKLQSEGYRFASQTDSEVIPHLVDYYYRGSYGFSEAVLCALAELEGAYAIAVVCSDCPGKIIAAANKSPLIIGNGEDENFLSSDINALSGITRRMYVLNDEEMACVTAEGVSVFGFDGSPIDKELYISDGGAESIDKGAFPHFMIKEIYQQPHILHRMMSENIASGGCTAFGDMEWEQIKDVKHIFLVGCGTAYHSALAGGRVIDRYTSVPVTVAVSSEFRYSYPRIDRHTLLMAVTQSGETADTLAAMKYAAERGARVVAITNTPRSSATRFADFNFMLDAGPEISVASTKAYTAQLAAFCLFAVFVAEHEGAADGIDSIKDALCHLPKDMTAVLSMEEDIKKCAGKLAAEEHIYYIGRGLDFFSALEGTLKMKEITYIHAEAYPAGELKHGPIALIDDDTRVIAVSTDDTLHEKTATNISEVITRGASVISVSPYQAPGVSEWFCIPETHWVTAPFVVAVVMQLLAYYTAIARGCDVDKPRNLAKSVTVE